MKTIYFHVPWQETDEEFLQKIQAQTPNEDGVWGEIRAVTDPSDADYHVAFNEPDNALDLSRLLLFCSEPPCTDLCDGLDGYGALAAYPLSQFYKPQRWWIKRNFDYLSNHSAPDKTKNLSWITSDKGAELHPVLTKLRLVLMRAGFYRFQKAPIDLLNRGPNDGHILRLQFLDRLVDEYPNILNLYGRGDFSGSFYHGEIEDKWDGLAKYRYSLAIENYSGPNYFSEKITDALLAWCMPIYWGCTNLDEYLPEDSFVEIDIEDPNAPQRVREIVESDMWERNLDAIAEARRRLLNEYQIWPTIERCVNKVEESREGQQRSGR